MYLEIDEGYWEHPKTLELCARLNDNQADRFPPRLWKWACRCARDGRLGKVTPYAFELVVRAEDAGGKVFAAFLASAFLDRSDDGEVIIHNWMSPGRTGHAIAKMEAKAAENRQRRADAKAKHEAMRVQGKNVPEPYQNRTSTIPSQTQTQTRHRPDTDQSSDPDSCPPGRPGGRIRKPGTELSAAFLEFWTAYPRKVGKLKAWKAWPGDSVLPKILKALAWQAKSIDWTKERGNFVPHPATYLGQGRWEDEPTKVTPREWVTFPDSWNTKGETEK